MTTCTLLPNGKQQFIDSNGAPYAGGSVYFYIPSTSTPKDTYQDSGAVTLNTNPVVLDSQGTAIIYGTGTYRQVLQDSLGNTVWDQLTQDVYGLVTESNNTFTGTNEFTAATSFTSTATAQTPAVNDSSTHIATTAFVANALSELQPVTFQNKFRNGGINVYQRGTSGTVTSGTSSYTADGFILNPTGANCIWSVSIGSGFGSSYNGLGIVSAIGLTDVNISQRIEGSIAQELNNAAYTLFQCAVFNNTALTITPSLYVNTANSVDAWGSVSSYLTSTPLQSCKRGVYTTVSYVFPSSSNFANGMQVFLDFGSALNSAGNSVIVTNFDIRGTSQTTGFPSVVPLAENRPIPFELQFCMRYLPSIQSGSYVAGQATAGTSGLFPISFGTPARANITGIIASSASSAAVTTASGGTLTVSAITFNSGSESTCTVLTTNTGTLVAGNASQLILGGQILFTGAEL